jgi:hypothetical protein
MKSKLEPKYGRIITFVAPPEKIPIAHNCQVVKNLRKLGVYQGDYTVGTRWQCPCSSIWEFKVVSVIRTLRGVKPVKTTEWRRTTPPTSNNEEHNG